MVLGDSSRLVCLEEQRGSEKTDFHESGAEERERKDLGPYWTELNCWTRGIHSERNTMKTKPSEWLPEHSGMW